MWTFPRSATLWPASMLPAIRFSCPIKATGRSRNKIFIDFLSHWKRRRSEKKSVRRVNLWSCKAPWSTLFAVLRRFKERFKLLDPVFPRSSHPRLRKEINHVFESTMGGGGLVGRRCTRTRFANFRYSRKPGAEVRHAEKQLERHPAESRIHHPVVCRRPETYEPIA